MYILVGTLQTTRQHDALQPIPGCACCRILILTELWDIDVYPTLARGRGYVVLWDPMA